MSPPSCPLRSLPEQKEQKKDLERARKVCWRRDTVVFIFLCVAVVREMLLPSDCSRMLRSCFLISSMSSLFVGLVFFFCLQKLRTLQQIMFGR